MIDWLSMRSTVAVWEFQRYFKLKDQCIGFVSLLIGAAFGFGAVYLARSSSTVKLAVLGASSNFKVPDEGHLKIVHEERTEQEWRVQVENKSIDGLLIVAAPEPAEGNDWSSSLIVRQEPTWFEELKPLLQAERMQWAMQAAHLPPATFAAVVAPPEIEIIALAPTEIAKTDRLFAYAILAATLITSWISLAYMMTGITGEKQQRVTEQIVSAIQPQMWIDGKLLGITAAAIASLAFLMATGLITLPAAWLLGLQLPMPGVLQRWEFIPVLLVYYLGGVMFWNCFYAGVSSIINDPNTSSRSGLLFLPMLPMIATGLVVTQPDGLMMHVLSWVPGTSPVAMPIRMVLGQVGTIEILGSLTLLGLGIAALRTLAGRVFAAGIMLYGKEPTWIDIASWVVSHSSSHPLGRTAARIEK